MPFKGDMSLLCAADNQSGPDARVSVSPRNQVQNMAIADPEHHLPKKKRLLTFIVGIEVFLAPINMVAGSMASHGENWKTVFVGFFSGWLFILGIGLYLDLCGRQSAEMTRRSLWHVGGCIIMMYTFSLIIQLTSDNLPQWIPLIMDSGLGVSVGLQNIPADSRRRLFDSLGKIAGNICGGVQLNFRGNQAHSANAGEPEP